MQTWEFLILPAHCPTQKEKDASKLQNPQVFLYTCNTNRGWEVAIRERGIKRPGMTYKQSIFRSIDLVKKCVA